MEVLSIQDYLEFIRKNFTDEQIMIAMGVKTELQARQIISNPILYPAFMTKYINKLGVLTGHELKMVL